MTGRNIVKSSSIFTLNRKYQRVGIRLLQKNDTFAPLKNKITTMKKIFLYAVTAVTVMGLSLTSCNKYEEGPGFTVRTAKARVTGDWKLTKYTINGTDFTSSSVIITKTIDKDGSYSTTSTTGSLSVTEIGSWEFNGDKTTITFTETGSGSTPDTWTILELRSKEMKLEQIVGSTTSVETLTAQ